MTSGSAQRRHITVMFCDMVGSTRIAGALDPEDFREVLSAYQHACARAIDRFEGWTAQWVGDGLVAYFGYPRAYEDNAQRAVHAGLAIIEELAGLDAGELHGITPQVRIGLHSGVVVAGEMGTGEARERFSVVGETPNIAARLEAIAPPGAVVVSDATRELVDGYFELRALGEKVLKGVSRPVGVYEVLRPTGAVARIGGTAPMVGRDAELARLTEAWERARDGHGAAITIPGEAGIGKSRLVRALAERVGPHQVWQCSAHHRSTPLHPVARVLTLDERAIRAAGLDPADTLPLLQDLHAPVAARSPRDARTATLQALEALLVTKAPHPLLLVVEDLHWADPTTVELLGRIVPRLAGLPVLCVMTFRREFEPPWTPDLEIELERLKPPDVRAMVAALGERAFDASAAGGVPLFVEALVKTPARDAGVPATLQGLLIERLDRLPELTDVIDLAAVLGPEFERDVLEGLLGRELDGALARLAAHEVLRPVNGARCEFTHALLQEAAYERLLRRRRRELHAHVADALERHEREPELIAHHWSAADQAVRAVPFWYSAGTRALDRAAFLEAAEHFHRALEGAPERPDLLTHLAAALQAGHGYAASEVGEAYARARAACEPGDRLVPVVRGQWMYELLRARYREALELAGEMLALGHRAEGHLQRGLVHMYTGDFERAREHLGRAASDHRPRSDHVYDAQGDTGAGALAYLALVLWNLGYADEAREHSDRSLELAAGAGPVTRAQAWGMRGILNIARVDPAGIAEWIGRTHAHSSEHNIGYWRIVSSLLLGWLQGRAGDLERGEAQLCDSLDAYLASGARLGFPDFKLLLADLRLAAGNRRGALDALRAAEEHIEATGERYSESQLYRVMGGVLEDPERATAAHERAVRVARRQNARLLELRAATHLAMHQRALGAPCTALDRVATLCEWFGADSELPDVVNARSLAAVAP